MTPKEEIEAVGEVLQAAHDRSDAALERAEKDLHLSVKGLTYYREFLDASVGNAASVLGRCSDLVSVPAIAAEPSTSNIVQGLLESVRETVRLMYAVMVVLEQAAGPSSPGAPAPPTPKPAPPEPSGRSCSFCGKTDAETKLVAGPTGNICASCTRLACGVLGIELSH